MVRRRHNPKPTNAPKKLLEDVSDSELGSFDTGSSTDEGPKPKKRKRRPKIGKGKYRQRKKRQEQTSSDDQTVERHSQRGSEYRQPSVADETAADRDTEVNYDSSHSRLATPQVSHQASESTSRASTHRETTSNAAPTGGEEPDHDEPKGLSDDRSLTVEELIEDELLYRGIVPFTEDKADDDDMGEGADIHTQPRRPDGEIPQLNRPAQPNLDFELGLLPDMPYESDSSSISSTATPPSPADHRSLSLPTNSQLVPSAQAGGETRSILQDHPDQPADRTSHPLPTHLASSRPTTRQLPHPSSHLDARSRVHTSTRNPTESATSRDVATVVNSPISTPMPIAATSHPAARSSPTIQRLSRLSKSSTPPKHTPTPTPPRPTPTLSDLTPTPTPPPPKPTPTPSDPTPTPTPPEPTPPEPNSPPPPPPRRSPSSPSDDERENRQPSPIQPQTPIPARRPLPFPDSSDDDDPSSDDSVDGSGKVRYDRARDHLTLPQFATLTSHYINTTFNIPDRGIRASQKFSNSIKKRRRTLKLIARRDAERRGREWIAGQEDEMLIDPAFVKILLDTALDQKYELNVKGVRDAKKLLFQATGIKVDNIDRCPKGCMAFNSAAEEECLECHEPRYHP
ncbi:hypothetical protein BJ508DRAFT_330503, partial [Ascobolus immersus RN42]